MISTVWHARPRNINLYGLFGRREWVRIWEGPVAAREKGKGTGTDWRQAPAKAARAPNHAAKVPGCSGQRSGSSRPPYRRRRAGDGRPALGRRVLAGRP